MSDPKPLPAPAPTVAPWPPKYIANYGGYHGYGSYGGYAGYGYGYQEYMNRAMPPAPDVMYAHYPPPPPRNDLAGLDNDEPLYGGEEDEPGWDDVPEWQDGAAAFDPDDPYRRAFGHVARAPPPRSSFQPTIHDYYPNRLGTDWRNQPVLKLPVSASSAQAQAQAQAPHGSRSSLEAFVEQYLSGSWITSALNEVSRQVCTQWLLEDLKKIIEQQVLLRYPPDDKVRKLDEFVTAVQDLEACLQRWCGNYVHECGIAEWHPPASSPMQQSALRGAHIQHITVAWQSSQLHTHAFVIKYLGGPSGCASLLSGVQLAMRSISDALLKIQEFMRGVCRFISSTTMGTFDEPQSGTFSGRDLYRMLNSIRHQYPRFHTLIEPAKLVLAQWEIDFAQHASLFPPPPPRGSERKSDHDRDLKIIPELDVVAAPPPPAWLPLGLTGSTGSSPSSSSPPPLFSPLPEVVPRAAREMVRRHQATCIMAPAHKYYKWFHPSGIWHVEDVVTREPWVGDPDGWTPDMLAALKGFQIEAEQIGRRLILPGEWRDRLVNAYANWESICSADAALAADDAPGRSASLACIPVVLQLVRNWIEQVAAYADLFIAAGDPAQQREVLGLLESVLAQEHQKFEMLDHKFQMDRTGPMDRAQAERWIREFRLACHRKHVRIETELKRHKIQGGTRLARNFTLASHQAMQSFMTSVLETMHSDLRSTAGTTTNTSLCLYCMGG